MCIGRMQVKHGGGGERTASGSANRGGPGSEGYEPEGLKQLVHMPHQDVVPQPALQIYQALDHIQGGIARGIHAARHGQHQQGAPHQPANHTTLYHALLVRV